MKKPNNHKHTFNIYQLLKNILNFCNNTFIKKTKYPIISICLFFIVIILNSIQYSKNDNLYLQNKIITSNTPENNKNALLYFYELIGINSFISNTPAYFFVIIISYFLVSLVELNIGHTMLLFLLFIYMMFSTFWPQFRNSICENNLIPNPIMTSPFCCGSFISVMSLGFILCLFLKNVKNINNIINIYIIIFILSLIIFIFFMLSLYDRYVTDAYMPDGSAKTCNVYTWHCGNFLFGIICGFALGN